jgi:tetratricopeptide (TPR) repeat protein
MHAERDHLVKVVFPELRERMAKRRLYLVDVDLRWGVTEEEAEHGKVLEVCLDEIERCRPFFIGILGGRYGYIPAKVPENIEFTYPWLDEYKAHSLTALEIIHGVLRNPALAQRAFFYFRDSSFISQVPETKRADFTVESPEAALKLAALKDKIRASGRPVMENYSCRWDEKQERIIELDAFGQQVLGDLWTAICAAYPEEMAEVDPLTVERQMHEAFAEERSRLHVGREDQARRLTEYVQGKDRRPAVITGESGCGKSAFLASWYRKYVNEYPNDFVLAYFIGASPDSTNHFRLLRNMCLELKRKFALKQEIPEEDAKLPDTLAVLLVAASKKKRCIVVLIDGLDQLLPLEAAHGLGWLLDYMHEKARLVVSAMEGDCLDVLRRREAGEIALPPLTENEQHQIVQTLLGEWRRKLDERQMASLLSHPSVKNPLYLRVALEELRLFGRFEQLTGRIQALAEDIPGLFDQVLARLEEDHSRELVSEAFSLICCSRYGLSETELLQLLRREGEEQFPRALWARLYRISRMYLLQRGELISFFHRQLTETVSVRYPERSKIHTRLASYFEKASIERRLDEYPYQLQHAEEWESLANALSDLDFFEYAWEHNLGYEWIGYWRSLKGRFYPGHCLETAANMRRRLQGATKRLGQLYHIVALFFYDAGLFTSALEFEERALEIFDEILGMDTAEEAESLNNLGRIQSERGELNEAILHFKRAMEIESKLGNRDDIRLANSLNNIGVIYSQENLYEEPLAIFNQALTILQDKLGPDHLKVVMVLNNIAGLYYKRGFYKKAKPVYVRVLNIEERLLGPHHPEVATTINNLACICLEQRKYAEARSLLERAQTILQQVVGPSHPRLATNLNNLATFYADRGRYKQALVFYESAIRIFETALGANHPNTQLVKNNLKQCTSCVENKFSVLGLALLTQRWFKWGAAATAVALSILIIFVPLSGGGLISVAISAPAAIGYAFGRRSKTRGITAGILITIATGILTWIHRISTDLPSIMDNTYLGTAVLIIVCTIVGALFGNLGAMIRQKVGMISFVKMR